MGNFILKMCIKYIEEHQNKWRLMHMNIFLIIFSILTVTILLMYITSKSFSKKIKSFDLKIGKNEWIKIHNEFYK